MSNGALATAGRAGSKVERSKGLKDAGCEVVVVGGGAVIDEATPTEETEGGPVLHGLEKTTKNKLFALDWLASVTSIIIVLWYHNYIHVKCM